MIIRPVKTFRRSMYGRKSRASNYIRFCERMARARAAKERKRLATAENPGTEWRGRLETTLTIQDRITGTMHSFDIHRGKRRDRLDIHRDGLPWKAGVTATWFAAALRKRLAVHVG